MKKIIFIFFIITLFLQSFSKCPSCNNLMPLTQTMLSFAKTQRPKTSVVNTNINHRPPFNNSPAVASRPKDSGGQSGYGGHYKIKPPVKPVIKPKTKPNNNDKETFNASSNTPVFGSTDQGLLVTTTSSGNTIVIGTTTSAGKSTSTNGNFTNFALASYANNGTLNTSFGTNGITITDFLSVLTSGSIIGSINIPITFAVQTNGFIIIVGTSNANDSINSTNSLSSFALARYKTNGSLDTSFNKTGLVLTNFATGSTDVPVAMSLQSNNKILVAGNTTSVSSSSSFVIARYMPNGSLDTSFNGQGFNALNIGATLLGIPNEASNDILTSMTVLSNQKIVLCGYTNYLSPNYQFAVMRFMSNGVLDSSFGDKGIALTNINATLNP